MTNHHPATLAGPDARAVDAAVRAVLAERFAASRRNGAGTPGVAAFAGRLLSVRGVETLGRGVRELKIAPGTVVTPLARDALKRLGIALRFEARGDVGRVGEWGFSIETGAESGVLDALRRALIDGADGWRDVGSSAGAAIRWVAEAEARGALLLTDEASVAVYRGCRVPGVRAASAADVESTARAVRGLGVNLLVVEPAGKPIALLKQIGLTFRRLGPPAPPDWLETAEGGRSS